MARSRGLGDVYKRQVFIWYGAWGIQWKLNGRVVHEVRFDVAANVIQGPFQRTPHTRLYAYAINSGASAASIFSYNCGAVASLGGGSPLETPGAASRTTALTIAAASGPVPLFSLRPAALFGGITNMRRFLVDSIVFRVTGQDFRLEAWLGRASDFTFTGSNFLTTGLSPRSAAERDIAATAVTIGASATPLGGTTITNADVYGALDLRRFFGETKASVGVNGDGALDNFVLTASALSGTNGTASLQSITWTELG
jgi:hypothetical protein